MEGRDDCEGKAFQWQVKVKLPLLARLAISGKFDELLGREASPKRPAYVEEVGGVGELMAAQQRALDFLVAEETGVLANVLRGAADNVNKYRENGNYEESEFPRLNELVPREMTPEQAAERIELTRIYVSPETREGMAYLEFHGECGWDSDHGFMVVVHGNRLVGCYEQGTGWVDPVSALRGFCRVLKSVGYRALRTGERKDFVRPSAGRYTNCRCEFAGM